MTELLGSIPAWMADSPDPIVVTDSDGRVRLQNIAFTTVFGTTDLAAPGPPVEDLIIVSRCRAAYRAARRLMLADGQSLAAPPASEFVALRRDGSEFSANLAFALTNEALEPLSNLSLGRASEGAPHVVTWIRDVTEDRLDVTALPSREVMHERAEALAGFGTWEWTPSRTLWSENLFRLYGLQPGEIAPSYEYVYAHCHPDDQHLVQQAANELGRTGRRRELRYRYVWPNGTVRHLISTVLSAAQNRKRSDTVFGTVQDVTDRHQAELELASRFAVSDALSGWEPGPAGARRLVRDLAEAMEFDLAIMWVPRDNLLVAWVTWQARAWHSLDRESDLAEIRLGKGDGLSGTAWASRLPTSLADLTPDATDTVRTLGGWIGAYGTLAVPALFGEEVLAVLTFASRRPTVLTDQFMRSLLGIGYEIGHFLARRRGELTAPVLSPRELQVLQLSATGYARRQIAQEIGLSEATVKTHLEHIYRKLRVADRASAVGEALRQGLIR